MAVRFKAFSVHLAISFVLALLSMHLVFHLWYPAPLHEAVGVTRIFILLLLVDVILGPLFTLLVYKAGKKTLLFDLAVIALIQLAALAYGLLAVAEGRPVWLVFSVDRFELVRKLDVDTRQLNYAKPEYRSMPWFGPRWVGAASPLEIQQRSALILESAMGGSDIYQRPNLYRSLVDMADDLRRRALPLEQLRPYNDAARLEAVLGQWPAANAWLPLKANMRSMVVLLDKQKAEVIAVVELAPWE